ncbi:hypothetical protein NAC44_10755 [Allorhizobium sp. BGMRC 0089]|uniref:hypothetical protein n=1 Tax=Allorhizobium sonneratiae TaxID=2934936 RepID=UPI0020348A5D|nr:hypothetical protein [Allorhizobium sonneratiae]MCM2292803.1 hypothetical protein [Allorhizobium sonneratiae]
MSLRPLFALGSLAAASIALVSAQPALAAQKDKIFFHSVAGLWSGPGEIVAGKYKGTKFNCNLTGEPVEGSDPGIKLGGTCRVGVFSQPMNAVIALKSGTYKGQFLDGAQGKGLDIISGQVNDGRAVMAINRSKLNGAMVASLEGEKAMNITISVKVDDQMVPVIGLHLDRQPQIDHEMVGSITK